MSSTVVDVRSGALSPFHDCMHSARQCTPSCDTNKEPCGMKMQQTAFVLQGSTKCMDNASFTGSLHAS